MDKVGRPDIDAFEAVMESRRAGKGGRKRGFFVRFGYTKDAEQECAAFYKRTGRIIKLLTVQSRRAGIDEEHVQKMQAGIMRHRPKQLDYPQRPVSRANRWIYQPWADFVSGIVVVGLLASAALWLAVVIVRFLIACFVY